MSKKVFAHWFMFPGLSRYLGRDRLSGDGSRACIVMGAPPGKGQACDILRLTCLASSGAGHFCAAESHRIMGSGERVSDSRTVFILMKSW